MAVEVASDGVNMVGGDAVCGGTPAVLEGKFGEAVEGAGDPGGELVEEGGGLRVKDLAGGMASDVEAVGEVGSGLVWSGEGPEVVAEADALVEGRHGLDEGAEVGLADEEDGEEGGAAAVEIGEPAEAIEGVCRHVLGFIEEQDNVAAGGGFGLEEGADAVEAIEVAGGRGGVGRVETREQGGDEFLDAEAAIFQGDEAEVGGRELVLEDRADEGFAAADLTGEQGKVHPCLIDDVVEAVEGFLMAGGRVKKASVPSGLKGSENEVPVEKGIGHGKAG